MCCDICLRLIDYYPELSTDNDNIKSCVICGRTMEFCEPLESKMTIVPRNKEFISVTPISNFKWVSKYGFVGVRVLNSNVIADGMNEVGLSCGLLTMDDTKYYKITKEAIAIRDVCTWILGQCSNVTEAVNLLRNIEIYGSEIPVLNRIIGLHIVIHDAYGASVVCEIDDGPDKLNIYYTEGVVTNGPNFPTQLSILEEYRREINTSKGTNMKPEVVEGYINQWSSIGRFIKLSELKYMSIPESYDSKGLIQLICHMFNNVDIIRGISKSIRQYGNEIVEVYGKTQWVIIKDLGSKNIYYRSYNDMTLRRIDLNKIDFSGSIIYPELSIDNSDPTIIDILV